MMIKSKSEDKMEGWKYIFCEGKTDLYFLSDILESYFSFTPKKDIKGERTEIIFYTEKIKIIEIGGFSKLNNEIYYALLQDNSTLKGKNFIFFDADCKTSGNGNKGFINCVKKLVELRKRLNLEFEYYIWPNNEFDGDIEDLLIKLIPNDRQCIVDCIIKYHSCLKNTKIENIKYSNEQKDILNYYLYTCNERSGIDDRDYKKNIIWNINYDEIEMLKKLKSFLDIHFS
jgi:hypothetical protein